MKKILFVIAVFTFCYVPASAQRINTNEVRVRQRTSTPACATGSGTIWFDDSTNVFRVCENGGSAANLIGSGAPTNATYIVQTANESLSAEQALSALSTGIMRVATTTGVITSLTDSAGIAANISDETGSGVMVYNTAPAFTTSISTPSILTASGTLTIAPASNAAVFFNTSERIQIGGTSNQFQALRRSTDNALNYPMVVEVADDSALGYLKLNEIYLQTGAFNSAQATMMFMATNGTVKIASTGSINWGSDATFSTTSPTMDAGIARNAAGVLEVNNGSAGTYRDVRLRNLLDTNGVQVVTTQGAAVADATGAGDVVAQLNALLARLRAHGLIAP
jgi:hypothetical protein